MSEFEKTNNNSENEITETTQKIIESIDDLGLRGLQFVTPSLFNEGAVTMFMQSPEQYRVVIEKAGPEYAPEEGDFFQGLKIAVHPGRSVNPDFKQIDYNFNEMGDGKFRKRVISNQENSVEVIKATHTYDEIAVAAMNEHAAAKNMLENMQLEEDMGVNNQPASLDELHEIEELLQNSVLLDPNNDYRPAVS